MRTLLFFDLPSITNEDKKHYRHFVKLIKMQGFVRIQESVFSMLSLNQQYVDSTISFLQLNTPPKGNIMVLTVTEKQYSSMKIILGDIQTDVITSDERVIII